MAVSLIVVAGRLLPALCGVLLQTGTPEALPGVAPGPSPADLSPTVTSRVADGAVPDGLDADEWAQLRAACEASRHAATPADGGLRARNPGQRWTTHFDGRGFTTTPDAGGWRWGLQLERYGWAGAEQTVETPRSVTADRSEVAYDWDGRLTEWYRNDFRGLEHGYTVHARPATADGSLQLSLSVRGDLDPVVSASGRDVRFVDARGVSLLDYAGLLVTDAAGRPLEAGFVRDGNGLRLTVDDAGAAYPLTIDPIAQQAYIKASNTGANDRFAWSVAICCDTVVIGALTEDSSATGVDGPQDNDDTEDSGAVYVFVRDGSTWVQQAYLKASNTGEDDIFGNWVDISGDTIIVGAPLESSAATGVDGDQLDDSALWAGAAYIFVRDGTTWSQQAYLKASNTEAQDNFGFVVGIDGDTAIVAAPREASDADGVDGDQGDNSAPSSGAAYVFVRSGTTWTQQAYLKASNSDADDDFGRALDIQGDTLLVAAYGEQSTAPGIDGDQSINSFNNSGAVYAYERDGTSWSQQAYIKASNPGTNDHFGISVSLSGDTFVVGASSEGSNATGVNGDQANDSLLSAGAAYVFVRDGASWSQQAYLKASNTGAGDFFGADVVLSGDTIVVGAYAEDSTATGINGSQGNGGYTAGAAYVFFRQGTSWNYAAYLKASNTGSSSQFNYGDQFAGALALDGDTLVAGARNEDSDATGVGGDQFNDNATYSGAAYCFDLDLDTVGFWTDVEGGTGGFFGPPHLTMSGPLLPSSSVTLDYVDGPFLALAVVFVSFTSTPAPFLGGTLHAFPVDELVVIATDAGGDIHRSVNFPGAASGQELWLQVGAVDTFVPIYGASLSNAVKGTVP